MIKLKKGVHLHVNSTKKFKTVQILIRFTAPLLAKNITKRTLLSSLMETNCKDYPTLTDMNNKLATMYGANFSINVSKKGNQHYFSLNLTIIDENILHTKNNLLKESIDFLQTLIFNPNIIDGKFEENTFLREKENLQNYIASIFEEKQIYANLILQELYFKNSADQKIPSYGTINYLENLTNEIIAEYYKKMISEDIVDIFVIGNVKEDQVKELFSDFKFNDREMDGKPEIFYQQPINNILQEKIEYQPIVQSKLNLGYNTGIYYHESDYFALQVFNGLFGGFPHSKLFMNVREKESMAYSVSSSIDTFRGFLSVQAGIDEKNREKVLELIHIQLKELEMGKISNLELEQTKRLLKNQYLLSLDNNKAIIEHEFLIEQLPKSNISDEQWLNQIDLVKVDDIKRVAKNIKLQALYFLGGEE